MKKRFKNKMQQGIYELGLKCTYPIPIDFHRGLLGGSVRVAWEDGYLGHPVTRRDKKSVAYAAYCAGKEVRSKNDTLT